MWHRKVPPSGLWLCGNASTWQWRARDTSTLHATPPRTVPHVPTPTVTWVCRHIVCAAAMSTGAARIRQASRNGAALGQLSSYALFSFSALATSGARSGTLLLVPSSTTHQEDSDGLMSSVEHLRVGSQDFDGRSTALDLTPRDGCAGQCVTVIFRQFMELLLPHLLMNGTAVSFKHRQCAANSLLIGVIVRTEQMASNIAVFLSHFVKGKFWPLNTGRKVLCPR